MPREDCELKHASGTYVHLSESWPLALHLDPLPIEWGEGEKCKGVCRPGWKMFSLIRGTKAHGGVGEKNRSPVVAGHQEPDTNRPGVYNILRGREGLKSF